MEQEEIRKLQDELDKKKWLQSEIARTDLSGKMSCCSGCPCRDNYLQVCTISHESRVANSVCAKVELKRRENNAKKEEKPRRTYNRKSKKDSTGNE